jgi:hypothetical protein
MFFNLPIKDNVKISDKLTWGELSSKIYDAETNYNSAIFVDAHTSFSDQFPELFTTHEKHGENIPIFSTERMLAAIRGITHDLLRYATYHNIEFIDRECRYDISRSVRGAVFTKWITTFRPYNFDCFDCNGYDDDFEAKYCNEFAASIYASHALQLTKDGVPIYIDELMEEPEEISTYLYTLRYRIKHQDSYSLFARRVAESTK